MVINMDTPHPNRVTQLSKKNLRINYRFWKKIRNSSLGVGGITCLLSTLFECNPLPSVAICASIALLTHIKASKIIKILNKK